MANTGSKLIHAATSGKGGASPGTGRPADHPIKRPKFYRVTEKTAGRGSGYELLNGRALFPEHPKALPAPRALLPPLGQRGFGEYPEMPVFLAGAKIRDFAAYSGYWLVSDRMKTVVERIDPNAFAFLKCRVQLRNGTEAPRRWLCDVVRVLDALDEHDSKVTIGVSDTGSKTYFIPMYGDVFFKVEEVGPNRIFRVMYTDSYIVCDEEMKLACKAADLTGIVFDDLTGRRRK
jgi:Protein of unknown function (DUF1629)